MLAPAFSAAADAAYAAGARGIRSERKVGDDERARARGRHALRVVQHVVEAYRKRGRVALDDHAERIADQQHVDTGTIGGRGERRVVGGQHRDPATVACHLHQRGNGQWRARTDW